MRYLPGVQHLANGCIYLLTVYGKNNKDIDTLEAELRIILVQFDKT